MLRLVGKLKTIEATAVLGVDLSWLSDNYQRALFHQLRNRRPPGCASGQSCGPVHRYDLISEQWDRMGQLYASLKTGHVTASVALKRLVAFTAKNRFYRANRELGRIFKPNSFCSICRNLSCVAASGADCSRSSNFTPWLEMCSTVGGVESTSASCGSR
jgi:hypothetical protein